MHTRSRVPVARALGLALASAALLIVSFPNFNQPWCAWVALVPWLWVLRSCTRRAAWWWSCLIGFLFFLGSLWWLTYVTILGWIVLCAYLALYFGVFGALVARVTSLPHRTTRALLVIPSVWVSLEYLRTHLLSGFGWNLLAHTQTPWRESIQIADVTGVWGVSFLIVAVNVALANLLPPRSVPRPSHRQQALKRARTVLLCVAAAVLCVLGYGIWRTRHLTLGPPARVAVVQGDIPQGEKWDETYQASIEQRYVALTERAASTRPDLIVWPETSVPGYLEADEPLTQWLRGLTRRVQGRLLVGAPVPTIANARVVLHNSALLLNEQGDVMQQHDKLHLVPFGEFVPFEEQAPWLRHVLPPIGDFSPGHQDTIFTVPLRPVGLDDRMPRPASLQLSVLVCFEDVFPELARRFVRQGAQLLVVITNDAWFGPTAAAYQHAQASTFRAIELRVPVVRAANTGWSGCIDATGRWTGAVHDAQGRELFVPGTHTCEVALGAMPTVYRLWGDWFAGLCLLVVLGWLVQSSRARGITHGP